jgi:3-oxoacyl-(acyl-carrier-protein) synthase
VFIESEEEARKRGSTIIAEIAGVGQSFDSAPGRGFNPSGEGARKAIELACEMAGVGADDVDMVVASANGSPEGDAMEARVLKELFPTAPVAAYKARTGECYGASAALNVVYGLLDMQNSRISGTGTHYNVDSGIDVVQTTRSLKRCDTIVVNAFSCDGNCSAIVLKRYQ